MFRNFNFSQQFKINIVDSFGFVLALYSAEELKDNVRYVMEDPDNDETVLSCLRTVLSALDEVQPGNDRTHDRMNAETIIEHFLSVPTDTLRESFERLSVRYEDVVKNDVVPEGYVSGYYPIMHTMDSLSAFFYYLKRNLREELANTVEDAFGVRVPEADINPEDLPQPLTVEDLQDIEEEESEFTPTYY